jgi:hypothetical protein
MNVKGKAYEAFPFTCGDGGIRTRVRKFQLTDIYKLRQSIVSRHQVSD